MQENGLVPIRVGTWGPFVLISLADTIGVSTTEEGWLGSAGPLLTSAGIDDSLQHVATREYVMDCNWKVIRLPFLFPNIFTANICLSK